jgi:UDP-glucose 4-epimerase
VTRKVLVTGGCGFIGSALVRRLVADGDTVRVLDDMSRGRADRLSALQDRIEVISGDIRDAAIVDRACDGMDLVCHLAAVNGTRFFYSDPDLVLEVGVRGMLNVLDALVRRRVPSFLFVSSSEVYQEPQRVPTDEMVPLVIPDPLNPRYSYAGSKLVSELLAINYARRGLRRVSIVRPHNVYGPDMGWEHVIPELVRRILETEPGQDGVVRIQIQGTGDETRAFAYIDDVVDGIARVIAKGEHMGIYHVGTDHEVSIRQLVGSIARCIGVNVIPESGPPAPGGTRRRCPDIGRLRALGYEPRVGLDEGLRRTVAWYASALTGAGVAE